MKKFYDAYKCKDNDVLIKMIPDEVDSSRIDELWFGIEGDGYTVVGFKDLSDFLNSIGYEIRMRIEAK